MGMKKLLALSLLLLSALPAAAADWSQLSGQFSRIEAPRAVVVRSAADWSRLWSDHMGADTRLPAPPVDFDREAVVAVFAGQRRTAGCEVRLSVRADAATSGVTVLYAVQPARSDGFAAEVLSQPFLIRKIARPSGPVVLERSEAASAPAPDEARREGFKAAGLRLEALRKALQAGTLFTGAL